jgi:hypothetical protein
MRMPIHVVQVVWYNGLWGLNSAFLRNFIVFFHDTLLTSQLICNINLTTYENLVLKKS